MVASLDDCHVYIRKEFKKSLEIIFETNFACVKKID